MNIIENDYLRAEIIPEAGASLVSLSGKIKGEWQPILQTAPPEAVEAQNARKMASFILAPFSNMPADGKFIFKGQTYQLNHNGDGNGSIQGDSNRHRWLVGEESTDYLVCYFDSSQVTDFNFPFPVAFEVHYSLLGEMLKVFLAVSNTGDKPIPAGLGIHPYFKRKVFDDGEPAFIQFSVKGMYPEQGGHMQKLPQDFDFSDLAPLSKANLDTCFGGWDGRAKILYPKTGVELRYDCDAIYNHLVLHNSVDEPYFCMEPVSLANNAFNLAESGLEGTGMRVLSPGERLGGNIRLTLFA